VRLLFTLRPTIYFCRERPPQIRVLKIASSADDARPLVRNLVGHPRDRAFERILAKPKNWAQNRTNSN